MEWTNGSPKDNKQSEKIKVAVFLTIDLSGSMEKNQ